MTGFIIFIIIAVVSNLLSKAKEAAGTNQGTKPSPAATPRLGDDIEQVERTRRIQEEIRRKIAERRGGAAAGEAQTAAETELPAETEWDVRQRQIREELQRNAEQDSQPMAEPSVPPLDPFGGRGSILRRARERLEEREAEPPPLPEQERTAEIAEESAVLAERLATAETIAKARAAETSWTEATKSASGASAWRKDLHSAGDLRRAMVLREVLGPPVALR